MMVDIRIMAHPSRSENVYKILHDLNMPDSIVIWDDRPNGGDAMYTARKAWTYPIPDGCTHRLVLQDDAELCNNFKDILEQVAKKHNDKIVTFFHGKEFETNERYQPFELTVGVALLLPVWLIDKYINFIDIGIPRVCGTLASEVLKHDTTCMRFWLRNEQIKCITTVPSLVQHIGDVSLVGIDRIRVSKDFTKNPPLTGW